MLCVDDPPLAGWEETRLPPLLAALGRDDCPELQYRALGALSNIAFGACEHAKDIANSEVIPKIISFISCEGDLSELAVSMLGNFALKGAMGRRGEMTRGAVTAILPYLRPQTPVRLLRTFVRAVSNFCSDEADEIMFDLVPEVLPYIHDLLDIENEESLDPDDKEALFIAKDIIVDACTMLANMMLGSDESIEAIQDFPGLMARLVSLLAHETPVVQGAALSAVGNMLAGTDDQVDRCLKSNCIQHIVTILRSSNSLLVAEATRAAANIFAGTSFQVQQALDQDILTPLQSILANGELVCQKQAVCAITNLCRHESPALRAHVWSRGVLEPYCALLQANDLSIAEEVVDGLYELIEAAEKDENIEHLCYILDEFDTFDHIKLLQECVIDESISCKISNMRTTLRKHAREERFVVHDDVVFTADRLVQDLGSQDQETLLQAIGATFCMLREQHPPVNALLEAGIMKPRAKGLDKDACPEFQHMAVWALCNFTAGSYKHKMAVIESGAIPNLLPLLANGDETADLAACSLGNIAPHGPATRDASLVYVQTETGMADLKTFLTTYSNLIRNFIEDTQEEEKLVLMINLKQMLRAIPFICELLHIENQEILVEACQACTNIIGVVNLLKQHGIEETPSVYRIAARLVDLLGHEASDVKENALPAVANMFSCTYTGYLNQDSQIDRCLDHVISFLQSGESSLVETAALTVCNMLNHKHSHIQRALEKDVLTPLLKLLADAEHNCQKLAARAVSIICYTSSAQQLRRVVRLGVLGPLCGLLASPDQATARVVLEGLGVLLQDADKDTEKLLCMKFDKIGVLGLLKNLLEHENEDIRAKADVVSTILRKQVRKEHVVIEARKVLTLAEIVKDLKCQDLVKKTRAAHAICRLLSETNPPISAVLQGGAVPPLVDTLDRGDSGELQCAAASAIFLISRGTHKHRVTVVNGGAIPKLLALLSQKNTTAELAATTLSYLTHRAPVTRDLVLAKGGVRALLPHMRPDTPSNLLRGCVAAYKNLCTDIVTKATIDLVSPGLPCLGQLLDVEDHNVLDYTCGALGNMLAGLEEGIEAVQGVPGLLARLVALLRHPSDEVKKAALSVVSNMFTETDIQTDRCLAMGCLEHIVPLLGCSEPSVVEQAAHAMHNLLRHRHAIPQAMDHDVVTPLLRILAEAEPNSHLQYSAAGALGNITALGTHKHKMAVVQGGAIPILVDLLAHESAVAGRAIAAIGYIAEDNPGWRDLVLAQGAVPAMLRHMRVDTPLELLTSCAWACWNLCRLDEEKPTENVDLVLPALPYISDLLRVEDKRILRYYCRALANLCQTSERIEAVQAAPALLSRLVTLLGHEATEVKTAAAVAVAFMFTGTSAQADRCLDAGCLKHIALLLRSNEPSVVEAAAAATRNIFSHTHVQIQRALENGILVPILNLLANAEANSPTQCSAAGAVSHMVSRGAPKHILAAVHGGAIPSLVTVLFHGPVVAELAANALANIAWLGPGTRYLVLTHGAVLAMLPHLRADAPPDLLKACLLACRNFCGIDEDTPEGALEYLLPALPRLSELLSIGHEHTSVLGYYCRALANLCQTSERIEAVQAAPALLSRLVTLLGHEATEVKTAAAVAVAFMFTGTSAQADRCLDAGCLKHIALLLRSNEPSVVEAAAAATRNIFSHTHVQIQRALENGILVPILNLLANAEANSPTQCSAAGAVSHMVSRGAPKHILAAVHGGAIPSLVTVLFHGPVVAELAANALANIAWLGPGTRYLVLTHGAVLAMLPHLRADAPPDLLKACLLACRNFCGIDEDTPEGALEYLLPALPRLSELLSIGHEHTSVLENACQALVGLSKIHEGREAIQATPGLTACLVALLAHEASPVKRAATVATICTLSGSPTQVDRCLDAGCLDQIVSLVQCDDVSIAELAVRATAIIVCHSPARLHDSLEKGVHASLINVLTNAEPCSYLRYYALGALVAIIERSTHEQKLVITQAGAIPILVDLLAQEETLAAPAAVALSNIAEIDPESRHSVLAHGAVTAILPYLRPHAPLKLLNICTVAISYFCRHDDRNPKENLELVSPALPNISDLLTIAHEEISEHACWAIVGLIKTHEGRELVQTVPRLTPRLLALLEHEAAQVKSVAIVAVMLMLSGTDDQVDCCLKSNCVEHIVSYLRSRDPSLMEKAAEAVRNTIGTTDPHTQRALCDGSTPLMTLLACPAKGQKVTVRAIGNLCRRTTAAQRDQLIQAGLLGPYCVLLMPGQSDHTLRKDVLNSLHELLQIAVNDETLKPFCLRLMEIGILDQVKLLQEHEDIEIKEKATSLQTYFCGLEGTDADCSI